MKGYNEGCTLAPYLALYRGPSTGGRRSHVSKCPLPPLAHFHAELNCVLSVTAAVSCVPFSVPLVYSQYTKISPKKTHCTCASRVRSSYTPNAQTSAPIKYPLFALAAQGIHEPCELCVYYGGEPRSSCCERMLGWAFTALRPCSRGRRRRQGAKIRLEEP